MRWGPGGQNVNKVSSAVHLRFDVRASALPEAVKERLLALHDSRITQDGVVVIKAQQFRSQEQNLADAMARLNALVAIGGCAAAVRPPPTKPTVWCASAALRARADALGETKALRGRVRGGD